MADKESLLKLRLQAMNEASPAFEGVSQSMSDLINVVQETSRSIEESFRGIISTTQEASRGMVTSLDEEGRGVNELRNTIETSFTEAANGMATSMREMMDASQEDSRAINESFRAMEEGLSAVVLAVRENTTQAAEAFTNMGRASQTAQEQTVGLWHDMGGIIGLQMMADEARKAGETLGHMFESAITSGAEFEGNMSRINAVLMKREPTANMKEMSDEALRLGSNSKFSANEIAQGMYDLARQGLSSVQILGDGVNGAIEVTNNLAQATDSSMSETATLITDIANEYSLSGQQLSKVGDIISGAMHTSSATMNDFYNAMKQVGPVASNMHQSVEDVSTGLALLAQHGIKGSQAGTALKNMFLGLEPRTQKAAELMQALGVSAKDGASDSFYQLNGNLKPMPDILDILNQKFGGLNDKQKEAALAATFTKYGLAGLNTVVTEGRDKFEELKKTLLDENAADIAAEKMNNLQGDMIRLDAATQTMSKSFGDTLQAPMRNLAQTAQGAVKWLTDLSPATKQVIMVVGGLAAVTLTLAGVLGSAAIAITLMQPGFTTLGVAARMVGSAFTGLLGTVRATTMAVGELTAAEAGASSSGLLGMLGGLGGGITSGLKGIGSVIEDAVKGPFRLLGSAFKTIKEFDTTYFLANARASVGLFIQSVKETLSITNILNTVKGAFSTFGEFVMGLGPKILAFVRTAFSWEGITAAASTALEVITGPWGMLVLGIAAGVGAIIANWDTIKGWVTEHFGKTIPMSWSQLKDDAVNIFNSLKQFFASIWDSIQQKITEVWNYIGPTITNAIKTISDYWKQIWPELKDLFVEVWHLMAVALAPAAALIGTIIVAALGLIKGAWQDAWNAIKDALKLVWDLIVGVLRVAWDVVSGIFKVALDILTGHWSDAWHDMLNTIKNVFGDVMNLFTNFLNNAFDFGKNLVLMIAHGIEGAIGSVIQAASNVASAIKNQLGFHSPTKEGPASDSDTWAPNFANMFASGLKEGAQKIQYAANLMITPLADQVNGLIKGNSPISNTMSISNNIGASNNQSASHTFNIYVNSPSNNGGQIGTDIATALRQQYNFAI
ncbi:phage tail tape measure protein [Desulfosporosinus sp. SB140]|uniref:phage tail tape measure protein n=1 Tax=Desulfosporosinus paludis TaxID=3115649 RepID=UPI00388DA44F